MESTPGPQSPAGPCQSRGGRSRPPGQAAAHGLEGPRQSRAGRRLPDGSPRLSVPRSVQAGKQTEQQVLCEILGLELFFFFKKEKK